METRRDVFQAIADPTRRAIILLLTVGALTPNAIAEHFNSSRQAVSKHLQVLTECEILRQEQRGREIHYHLNADKMKEIENWLAQFRELLDKRFSQLDEVLKQLKKSKS
jgi:DNA-binding transcriptional ArsR family regulator